MQTGVEGRLDHAFFFFQAEDGIRDLYVTGVQTCALPISPTGTLFLRALPIKRRRRTMNDEKSISWKKLQEKWLTRRNLIRGAAGTAAGAGLVLGSGRRLSALADEGKHNKCEALARPIPHITGRGHFVFSGPPAVSAPSTFPHFPFAGFDPS